MSLMFLEGDNIHELSRVELQRVHSWVLEIRHTKHRGHSFESTEPDILL